MAKRKARRYWRLLPLGTAGLMVGLGGVAACGDLNRSVDVTVNQPSPSSQVTQVQPPPTNETALPPISGGTLLVTADDTTAVAADPDRDSVWLVDLPSKTLRTRVQLAQGSEPGRVVEDQFHTVHVALRRGGQVVSINPQSGAIVANRQVCAAPRGLAYDSVTNNLYVACAGGELVTLQATGGGLTRILNFGPGLRDVAVKNDHLLVSRFRTAELLEIDASGNLLGTVTPRQVQNPADPNTNGMVTTSTSSPTTAWRMVAMPDGDVVMLHQRGTDGVVSTKPGGYGMGGCGGVVSTGVTVFSDATSGADGIGNGAMVQGIPLAVDIAVSRDGQTLGVISPNLGNSTPLNGPVTMLPPALGGSSNVNELSIANGDLTSTDTCHPGHPRPPCGPNLQPIAGSYDGSGTLWVQVRNPAQLVSYSNGVVATTIPFTNAEDRTDPGHALFHTPTAAGLACASCHAEAGDDGHIWNFDTVGPRRTPIVRGGFLATAPFHWDGSMTDMTLLMTTVFTGRMSGGNLTADQVTAVGSWVNAQPALPKSPPPDPQAAQRGQVLFTDATVGCVGCHSGTHFTNNQNEDVGTGQAFQVPSLIDVSTRAPYLHNGCAATLQDRFNPSCGGTSHGNTSQLAPNQISDLIAYLNTL